MQAAGSFLGQELAPERQPSQQALSTSVLSRPRLAMGSPQPRPRCMPQWTMGDLQVARGGEGRATRGCGHQGHADDGGCTLPPFSEMAKNTWLTWVRGLPKLSPTSPLQTIRFPSVRQDNLPLASSSALVSSHTEHQETAAARASAFLWRKQRAVAKGSHSSLPSTAPSWGWGLSFSPAWPPGSHQPCLPPSGYVSSLHLLIIKERAGSSLLGKVPKLGSGYFAALGTALEEERPYGSQGLYGTTEELCPRWGDTSHVHYSDAALDGRLSRSFPNTQEGRKLDHVRNL